MIHVGCVAYMVYPFPGVLAKEHNPIKYDLLV